MGLYYSHVSGLVIMSRCHLRDHRSSLHTWVLVRPLLTPHRYVFDLGHHDTHRVSLFVVKVHLPDWVESIEDRLAENIHDVWAVSKIKGGWKYNKVS